MNSCRFRNPKPALRHNDISIYMKRLKILLFSVLALTPLIVCSQPGTSDTLILVKKRHVENLIHDVKTLHALEEYMVSMQIEINYSDSLIRAQQSLITVKDAIINSQKPLIAEWEKRFNNQVEMTKQEKRGKRRWRITTIAVTAGSIFLLAKTID